MPLTSYDTFADILESITDAFLSVDAGWNLTYFNQQAETTLGLARDAVLGHLLWEVTPFVAGSVFETEFRAAIASGERVHFEAFVESRDQWFEVRAFPLKSGGLAAYFRDVTKRKWAEEAVAERELRLEQALEAGEMGAWQIDIDARTLESTPICRAVYGLSPEDSFDFNTLFQLIHPEDRERVYALVARAVEQHMPFRAQYRVLWPDGTEHWISTHGQFTYDVSQPRRHLVGVSFDITGRKTMALERERLLREAQIAQGVAEQAQGVAERAQLDAEHARAQAEAANRLKDEFLATLSHELRTPLMAIIGWADMLAKGVLNTEQQAQAAEVILRNSQQQAQLVEDVLDVSRIITGKMRLDARELELGGTVWAAIESLRPTAQSRGVVLQVQLDETPCIVSGDPDRLQQVFWNLLSNAIKFTPPKGCVRISLESIAPYATVVVTDTGRGIPSDTIPYIFERFRQGDSSSTRTFGGLGIGLSLVRHLVELHGGSVEAHSQGTDKGATFIVRLPLKIKAD
jgi:PAS domain S-box-containing protein